jgi:hypothetical protein
VRGNPVYLGVTGGPSTWTAATTYTQLTLSFTSAAGQTSAQLYLHGWYGAGTYHADDVVLDGPGGTNPGTPATPGSPSVTATTASSVALSWPAAAGATGYRVYEGNTLRATVSGTSATISGLGACETHTYTVAAYNSVGESARSTAVTGTTSGWPTCRRRGTSSTSRSASRRR